MKAPLMCAVIFGASIHTLTAADQFIVGATRQMHDDVALDHAIYTDSTSAELCSGECNWFRNPAVGIRFDYLHAVRRPGDRFKIDSYNPGLTLKARTVGDINVGFSYAHTITDEEIDVFAFGTSDFRTEADTYTRYVAKQFDCGLNLGVTYAYGKGDFKHRRSGLEIIDFGLSTASGAIGYARSFGERTPGRNLFVDTSVNMFHLIDDESWDFGWLAKLGTAICPDFAVYGVFNLYHQLEDGEATTPIALRAYQPLGDETWGEAGGGFQARLGKGFTLTSEATVPSFDDGRRTAKGVLVRADLTWNF